LKSGLLSKNNIELKIKNFLCLAKFEITQLRSEPLGSKHLDACLSLKCKQQPLPMADPG